MRKGLFAAVVLLGLAVLVYWLAPQLGHLVPSAPSPENASAPPPRQPPLHPPERIALSAADETEIPTTPVIPIANRLGSPQVSAEEDLKIVLEIFDIYKRTFGSYPAGEENRHFTNALTGRNPERSAFIAPHHPSIGANGDLRDRWGRPYRIHLVARDLIEIRSAGPDREFATGDDLEIASPALRAAKRMKPPGQQSDAVAR